MRHVRYVLNGNVLPNPGRYDFREVTIEKARNFLRYPTSSAVGHRATAEFMSKVIGTSIPYARIEICMKPGDEALVFWLPERQPLGTDLTKEQLRNKLWKLGVIKRIK